MVDSETTGAAGNSENNALDIALDPSDPVAREAQTFQRLSPEMLARVARYGSEGTRLGARADLLARRSQRRLLHRRLRVDRDFDVDEHGLPQVFIVLRACQFAGEIDLINDRQVLVSARAGEASVLLRVRRADFRRLVSAEADIGEIRSCAATRPTCASTSCASSSTR